MKLFEYADNITLPNGKKLDVTFPKSYPFFYINDKDFFLGNEGSTHIASLENYLYKNNNDFSNIDPYDYDQKDNFLFSYLDAATYTGRVWLEYKVMAFWDLKIDALSRLRLKDIIKNLQTELDIKIDPKEWWIEFSDTTTTTTYFVILNDFIENNDLKYGIMDTNNKVSNEVRKSWHLLNSAEKIKLKTEYGMDKWKGKDKPLSWKQSLLKSESIVDMMTPLSKNQIREHLKKIFKTNSDIVSIKIYNPSGIKLVNNFSNIDEENYRVNYHKLTGDVLDIYYFLIDHFKITPYEINDVIINKLLINDDDELKYIPIKYRKKNESKIISKFNEYINESIVDKMKPKSNDEVIKALLHNSVDINEYIDQIKNSVIDYLKNNNIDIKDVIFVDDLDTIDFITNSLIKNKKDVIQYEDETDVNYFSYFNFYKDDIIIIADDSGELNIAIININKLKDKLYSKNENNFISLSFNINNKYMQINERVEAKMDLPQDIINFYNLFKKRGFRLYVVGGAVRDFLMGKKPHDFDMVSNATPDIIMDILKDYRTDLQGVHFGIVRVFTDDEPTGYEVASYRLDISKGRNTKGTDKKVEIGKHITIKDDVKRRDFTMNALFYDIGTGDIVDVVGGINDIRNKIVKAVGTPQKRFDEDRLRILRAIRFAAVTDSELDLRTAQAIKNDSRLFGISDVDDVSRERIFLEFKKVKEKARENNDPIIIKRFVDMLIDFDIMEQIFPVKVLEKSIKPTTYLSVAIAQVLRKNEITPEFKQILVDSKIPTNFVDIISVLIRLYNNGVTPEDVYELYKEVRNKEVRRDVIEEWINVMGIRDKSVIKFLDYVPTTSGDEVMKDGFRGAGIGNEIRKREAEKFKKLLKESIIIKKYNKFNE